MPPNCAAWRVLLARDASFFDLHLLMQVRISLPDMIAATDDFGKSPLVDGVCNNGFIMLNPDTITPEGLKLLAEAFSRQELRMGEDRVCFLYLACKLPQRLLSAYPHCAFPTLSSSI